MDDETDGNLKKFDSAANMVRALADEIVALLIRGVEQNGKASFAASGGTTPGALYDVLAARDAPWDKIWITLSDERWIDPSQDGSNEKLVRDRLLQGKAAAAHFVALKTADANPRDAEAKTSNTIAALPRPFDVMLLGMGDDGHTASLYPDSKRLPLALDVNDPALTRAMESKTALSSGERMTMTLRALLDSRLIVILIKGNDKLKTYQAARDGQDVHQMPIRAILQQTRVPVQVFWAP